MLPHHVHIVWNINLSPDDLREQHINKGHECPKSWAALKIPTQKKYILITQLTGIQLLSSCAKLVPSSVKLL
jgi:hypothetical protein